MIPKHILIVALFIGHFPLCVAQETERYANDKIAYQNALELYNNQQLQASQILFNQIKLTANDAETEANSAYYSANAAIRLNQPQAEEQMEAFVRKYPTSTKRNIAYLDVAEYYFEIGKYPHALKWYKLVDRSSMTKLDEEKYNFKYGYALYAARQTNEAETYLKKVVNSPTYGEQAKYYLGYIAYQRDDYVGANSRFEEISDTEILREKLTYYQADLNFKQGNFEEAIRMAKKQLPLADRQEASELNKIIGESHFYLGEYQTAIGYLDQYNGKKGKFSNTDYYYLGYCHYKLGAYEKAIAEFNQIVDGNNGVAQNAYYHLGECYLRRAKKTEALNAFRNAASMDFDKSIEKDALLNYARLSYEVGNPYEPVPKVMRTYLEKYPNDGFVPEIQQLLVDSYITSKNFKGAMELLEENEDFGDATTYQKVTFYRGVELMIDEQLDEAITAFTKSIAKNGSSDFKNRALFWRGEAHYQNNDFEAALIDLNGIESTVNQNLTEVKKIPYHLGYIHFKLKQYQNAAIQFKKATTEDELGVDEKMDAFLRLGDSYFASSSYANAIEAYSKALNLPGDHHDYAAYQSALSHGFKGDDWKKIGGLIEFLNTYQQSYLRDDALFELGNSYIKVNEQALGLSSYNQLVTDYRNSPLTPQAILRQGLVYYNSNKDEEALSKLKGLVNEYPKTLEAQQAVSTIELIYIDKGRVSEFAAWARQLDFVEVDTSELEVSSFEAAQKKLAEGDQEAAILAFEDYLKEFPNGLNSVTAKFKLAELYYGTKKTEQALQTYLVVLKEESPYVEKALVRIAEIHIAKEMYSKAKKYLEQLELVAELEENKVYAQSNLMKTYYQEENYQLTIAYAKKVMDISNIDDRIKSDAQIMIARSAVAKGEDEVAAEAFNKVKRIATGALAAEAWYYDAFYKNKFKKYEASNMAVQQLAKDYPGYKNWSGKGLVVMAKNFYALEDAFQATYILESVIENFNDYAEIVKLAKKELAIIKKQESLSNSSVDPNN